ncbi:universal stress protein [Biformimicrobium ophioploci]|uniref:Universal stress protein UspE n=1 Tax=Biformimicrobium ophioploci TaxID=3036711 RepID=A0ABQ6M018_9GAMM|nr:universal stress protein [Microbulbifer sp. NKW57]GMG87699.1 universal stress protein UspE [Microbulbifer sp. NKW57]
MKKVLVILDKPKHEQIALQRALDFAGKNNVQLHLMSFVYEPMVSAPHMYDVSTDLIAEMKQGREHWMESLRDKYQLPDNTETEAIWYFDIAGWALEHMATHSYDLVIKTAQKQYGKGGFGSIDWRLIEHAPVPVWLAVNTPWIKREKVVAALDPALDNELHQQLNGRVLAAGGDFASRLDSQLEVAACLPFSGILEELGIAPKPEDHAEKMRAMEPVIQGLLDKAGVESSQMHLLAGKPAREINRVVDRNKAKLMIVGRGVREGAGRLLLGNTAERILGRANTDVLVVP